MNKDSQRLPCFDGPDKQTRERIIETAYVCGSWDGLTQTLLYSVSRQLEQDLGGEQEVDYSTKRYCFCKHFSKKQQISTDLKDFVE